MRASGRDADSEMRVQLIAGLSLGVFGLAALATAVTRSEAGLGAAGAAAAVFALAFVLTASVRLHRLHRRSGADSEQADEES
ncbi:hypothetical protein [Streptomonospora litoralis]|uniref:Uncharacterized protein n=1 Tax=Streptomonospora litoralis TaxID=2498135 RepID=A0A4P6Q6U8_9ACTN|nr:hypothetical protein [Streptomonospora litoralis]QBI56506.1 hypothetical protein EKD16_23800 [Streptomonospora litoralis]